MLEKDKILNLLIEHSINIGNSLAGKGYPSSELKRYGEPLALKTVHHICSIQRLCVPKAFVHSTVLFQEVIDFPSIAALTRTALESYLTFNYIFVAPQSVEEKEFRYYCWDLAGYIERENFPTATEESVKRHAKEQEEKTEIFQKLACNSIYKNISAEGKKKILKGNWRVFKSWRDLAIESGLPKQYFDVIYSYMSSYSHSGRLCVMQIEQSRDIISQKAMADLYIQFCLEILARLIHDYILYMPDSKHVHEVNHEAAFYTELYYKIGNQIKF
ncbi:DUF5677 domain-containing protein [Paludibacter jiangxiensis]|uniref:Uncharacterized protein n=1 Tax=Paludibacter jiangxiensis TaxID=681398 RepID=A0A171AFI2_9BACT|nr:DUF5677 domain-containing protein [Paludibacter jiangxiensis]GAT63648.1 hypothetical protein PJIAN_4187 [Paludibacter jiangxiensis]